MRRAIPVSEAQRERILECHDLETLDRWFDRAFVVATINELLALGPTSIDSASPPSLTIPDPEALIRDALERLFNEVQFASLNIDTNERSLTHRLAVHLEHRLQDLGIELSVDCEYNRHSREPKRLRSLSKNLEKLCSREQPGQDTRAITVFPDVIVHKRGSDDANQLVIEVKRTNAPRDEIKWDEEKLRAYRDELKYKHAYCILLGHDLAHTKFEPVPP